MNLSLIDKTALVAGSTQGIGKATALGLAEMGATIVLIARNEDKLKDVLFEIGKISNKKHGYIVADFSDSSNLKNILASQLKDFGPIQILVNNTGGPPAGAIIEAEVSAFKAAFEMHLLCNHILVQSVLEGMKASHYGRIVNVISTSVKIPLANLGVSNTIRGAVANWSKTLANELGMFNITVNNVLPGATNTARLEGIAIRKAASSNKTMCEIIEEMGKATPMGRVAEPEEIANAICFLSSPAASYINGINLPVDGGRTGSL